MQPFEFQLIEVYSLLRQTNTDGCRLGQARPGASIYRNGLNAAPFFAAGKDPQAAK